MNLFVRSGQINVKIIYGNIPAYASLFVQELEAKVSLQYCNSRIGQTGFNLIFSTLKNEETLKGQRDYRMHTKCLNELNAVPKTVSQIRLQTGMIVLYPIKQTYNSSN